MLDLQAIEPEILNKFHLAVGMLGYLLPALELVATQIATVRSSYNTTLQQFQPIIRLVTPFQATLQA